MSNVITVQFVLGFLTVALGGGTVQLLVFILRRRADLRHTNTASDVNVSTASLKQAEASEKLFVRLEQDNITQRDQVRDLTAHVARLDDRATQAQRNFTEDLRIAHAENARLATRIAQLQTDHDIATRQLAEIRRRFPPD